MIILLVGTLLGTDRPAFTYYLAGVETLLEAFMVSALIGIS